jgi:general secretion pathway protein D
VLAIASASAGQTDAPSGSPLEKRQKADDMLRRARELMAKNDLAGAEALVAQAEALNPQYPMIYMGDTPKKARQALEGMRSAANGPPARPSSLFPPLGLTKKTPPPVDPFASRSAGSVADPKAVETSPDSQKSAGLPTTGRPDTATQLMQGQSPFGRQSSAPPADDDLGLPPALARGYMPAGAPVQTSVSGPAGTAIAASDDVQGERRRGLLQPVKPPLSTSGQALASDGPSPANARAQSDELLRSARRALAVGDVRRATELVAKARQLQVRYSLADDSPEKVEATIGRFNEVNAQGKNGEASRRNYARLLMEEADALFTWKEYDLAEQLARTAEQLPVTYGPLEAKPEDLLKRIAAERRGSRSAGFSVASSPPGPGTPGPSLAAKSRVTELVTQARAALSAGQLDLAESLAREGEQMRIPDAAFMPNEDRPGTVLLDIRQARTRNPAGVALATGSAPAGSAVASDSGAARAVYDPGNDPTRILAASGQQILGPDAGRLADYSEQVPTPATTPLPANKPAATPPGQASQGYALFQQGEAALKAHDGKRALELFRQAHAYRNELDPVTAQRLQDHLMLLQVNQRTAQPGQAGRTNSPVDEAAAKQQALARQVTAEVAHDQTTARAMVERDPKGSLAMLEKARKKVEAASLEASYRDRLLKHIDRDLAETKRYIEQNAPRIEQAAHNKETVQGVEDARKRKQEMQQQLAKLVDEYNKCLEEHRYAEAEVVAKKAAELAPREPIVQVLVHQSKVIHELDRQREIREGKEKGFRDAMDSVDLAARPMDDQNPIHFPEGNTWRDISRSKWRKAYEARHRFNEREREIQRKLKTPVNVKFHGEPLSQALDKLAKMTGVNIHLDDEALKQEGISADMPVNLEVTEITLKSVLNLLLNNHHLAYVIKDEVLKVTSEQMRAGQVYTVTYNVADLVMPIPNFVPGPRMGLENSLHNALGDINAGGFGGGGAFGAAPAPMAVVASADGKKGSAAINPALLAQVARRPGGGAGQNTGMGMGMGGPGGAGAGVQPDFDSLIDLLTSTVAPTTWDTVGGPGSVAPFVTNLSIVVSQTQEVHEEIVDLLEQLRRMQDLQVTIEVRFITLSDSFFERMGVDFDFNIRGANTTNAGNAGFTPATTTVGNGQTQVRAPGSPGTAIVGLQDVKPNPASQGVFTSDLDIPFTQGSYALAVPQFGGYQAAAGAGASLGFAVLSDIEAFFFVNAAQGDVRSNVLQAPKVTLFNGQQAFVSDTSQTPFVISVVPVVGDFAAAQQPVIVVLSEGSFMTVQAVVSNDRRFVRLTLVPFFSKIGEVQNFTFQGSETTTEDTTREGLIDAARGTFNNNRNNRQTTRSGTTVQLPTFSFVTVTTTVSVPDGGTVLLGGIKRLNEERREYGTPILDKIPYLNRLFKNVGIGRDTSSLMMMVTPRIIIQEEEEEKLGIQPGGP